MKDNNPICSYCGKKIDIQDEESYYSSYDGELSDYYHIHHINDEDNQKPSSNTFQYWISSFSSFDYPIMTNNPGKWLIFRHHSIIDPLWEKVEEILLKGYLGKDAKVSTAKPSPLSSDPEKHVICVYTYDWTDRKDVYRIRQELRKIGVYEKICYKTNEDTRKGRYAAFKDQNLCKYWE